MNQNLLMKSIITECLFTKLRFGKPLDKLDNLGKPFRWTAMLDQHPANEDGEIWVAKINPRFHEATLLYKILWPVYRLKSFVCSIDL